MEFFCKIVLLNSLLLVASGWAQSNPVPRVNNPLVPTSARPGGAGFTLTVDGTGFVSGSVVEWNGVALATTFVNGSQLTAAVPASNIASAGTASVSVLSPAPGGGVSNVDYFGIRKPFAAVSFGEANISWGQFPVGLAVADFNTDGNLDVATINDSSDLGSVSILLGNGNGMFQSPIQYSVGDTPLGLTLGDFNNDGNLDLSFVNYPNGQPGVISVMPGNGDGSFQPPINSQLVSGEIFYDVVAGDFNGDGKLDLAVTNRSASQVLILLGNGDGTFQSPVGYAAGTKGAYNVTTGDFNQDGNLDLVVSATFDTAIVVLLGNGNGTFQTGQQYSTGLVGPLAVLTADLNHDGKLDVVADTVDSFTVFLGNGDGTFQQGVKQGLGDKDNYSIAAVDLNADGNLDIVAGEQVLPIVSSSLGNGDGSFQSRQLFPAQFAGGLCCVVAGDFNGDGLLDLVESYGTGVTVFPSLTSVLSTTHINFDSVKVGSTAMRMFRLRNIGSSTIAINKIKFAGKNAAQFRQRNDCGSALEAGTTCTFTVAFVPQMVGHFKEVLTILNTASSTPQQVTLEGIGD
jgi:hypothetical protein